MQRAACTDACVRDVLSSLCILAQVFLTSEHLAIVTEYAVHGSLRKFLKRTDKPIPEALARWIYQQHMLAVDYCQRKVGERR